MNQLTDKEYEDLANELESFIHEYERVLSGVDSGAFAIEHLKDIVDTFGKEVVTEELRMCGYNLQTILETHV